MADTAYHQTLSASIELGEANTIRGNTIPRVTNGSEISGIRKAAADQMTESTSFSTTSKKLASDRSS